VSEFQAARLREHGAVHCQVIHHGVDVKSFPFGPEPSRQLLFIGRLDATKGPDLAIAAARTLGWPLTLAGPITDRRFFEQAIEPLLGDTVRYVGIASPREKRELFRQAGCVLVPSRVEEAGPLVAIEALACGTPVVGLANGGLPELVEDGVTGYATRDEARLPDLIPRALGLDRSRVRARAEERFDLLAVARRYRDLYQELASAASPSGRSRPIRAR
jgi:glycosyltransferase involved in cell wall biosynthesis